MAQEADFYSAGEVAKALGIPEIQVFAMLSSGKLEGQQDQWARWCIPAGAVARAQQDLKPSSEPGGSPEDEPESHAAKIEAGGEATTTNRSDQASLQKPSSSADVPSGEETTQEAGEAPAPTRSPASDIQVARVEEKDHYTVDEAAQILELSPACVRQMLRAGELEGERCEKPIDGVLGHWRIPKRAVHVLREGDPDVLQAKRRNVCDASTTTTARLPLLGEATTDTPLEALLAGEESADGPSEASELLSESVREVRAKAEALRKELELLEGRLELMEITESTLREGFQREKERADREQEKADKLQDELERERAQQHQEPQGSWRRLFRP